MKPGAEVLLIEAQSGRAEVVRERLLAAGLFPRLLEYSRFVPDTMIGRPDVALVVVDESDRTRNLDHLAGVLDHLTREQVRTLVIGSSERLCAQGGANVQWLGASVSIDEVMGRLTTLAHYEPLVRKLERELHHVQKLGEQLNRYFGEIDQEMRLAGRLQRDFLPRELPNSEVALFATLYRPASWVSGDIYDVIRIDPDNIGIFVADAMGHGVAAGLLTMFLRQALAPTSVQDGGYTVRQPADVIRQLNDCLVRQKLPNCQFVTAAYATLHLPTRTLRVSRAGHPYPVLVRAGTHALSELTPVGGLLGLPDLDDRYDEATAVLSPGDKLILYTDGLEDAIITPRANSSSATEFTPQFAEWCQQSPPALVQTVAAYLDRQEGSLNPADDVTLLSLEIQ